MEVAPACRLLRRAQFVPQMVNGLMKLGLPQNATLENRRLSLDLAGLVVHWEHQRIAEARNGPSMPVRGLLLHSLVLPNMAQWPASWCTGSTSALPRRATGPPCR
jgi:hypothetical protein